jgi:hypothetical protein
MTMADDEKTITALDRTVLDRKELRALLGKKDGTP